MPDFGDSPTNLFDNISSWGCFSLITNKWDDGDSGKGWIISIPKPTRLYEPMSSNVSVVGGRNFRDLGVLWRGEIQYFQLGFVFS